MLKFCKLFAEHGANDEFGASVLPPRVHLGRPATPPWGGEYSILSTLVLSTQNTTRCNNEKQTEKCVQRMGQLLHYTFSKYLELVSILIHLLSVKQTSSASKIDCYTLNLIDFLSWITNPTSIIHSEFRNLGKWTL